MLGLSNSSMIFQIGKYLTYCVVVVVVVALVVRTVVGRTYAEKIGTYISL